MPSCGLPRTAASMLGRCEPGTRLCCPAPQNPRSSSSFSCWLGRSCQQVLGSTPCPWGFLSRQSDGTCSFSALPRPPVPGTPLAEQSPHPQDWRPPYQHPCPPTEDQT